MFLIDTQNKKAVQLEKRTFSELKLSERHDLQEWIVDNPEILGEKLLIIQKEFNGFSDTNERLDLLALDKSGKLVVIENKLDDSGKDVVWQALKYVSYCSTLTKSQICKIFQDYIGTLDGKNAEERIAEFYDEQDYESIRLNHIEGGQRIILVAANFRKEVTSTVLWLRNYHGVDRLLNSLGDYYLNKSPKEPEIQVNLVGNFLDGINIEKLISKNKLEEYVSVLGNQFGEALDCLYDQSDLGVVALAFDRIGVTMNSSLKSREYIARGIPLIYQQDVKIDCLDETSEGFAHAVEIKDEQFDFRELLSSWENSSPDSEKMRNFAKERLSWKSNFEGLAKTINEFVKNKEKNESRNS